MSPIVPIGYTKPTGKNNLLTSFNKWLETNVPAGGTFTYFFMAQLQTQKFPAVHVNEYPYFTPKATAFGDVVFEGNSSEQGQINSVIIEFNIYDDVRENANALKNVRQIRDRLVQGLRFAGQTKDTDNSEIVPPIKVLDYDNAAADTNIVAEVPVEEDNWITEQPFQPTAEDPHVYRHQMLVRVKWYEL